MESSILPALEATYAAMRDSMLAKDCEAFLAAHAPDFVYVEEWRNRPLAEWKASLAANFAEITAFGPVAVALEDLAVEDARIVATVRWQSFVGRERSEYEQFEEHRTRDTWERRDDRWRLVAQAPMPDGTWGSVEPEEPKIDSPALAELAGRLREGDSVALERFWQTTAARTPLVEAIPDDDAHRWVTFLWRDDGATRDVELHGGLISRAPKPLTRLGGTDLWFRTERLPADTRLAYEFAVRRPVTRPAHADQPAREVVVKAHFPDPLNPPSPRGGSTLELPQAPLQPWAEPRDGVPNGTLQDETIASEFLKEERPIRIYLPPGYELLEKPCDLLVLFDGEAAQSLVPAPTLLDNLLAEARISPTVAVLIPNQNNRTRDLSCSAPFADFLAHELLPWVRGRYRVTDDPARTIVSGISLGGLMATYCGFRHPTVFGAVLCQSGSFWYYDGFPEAKRDYATEPVWLARQFASSPRLPLRFYIEAGRFEGLLEENRHLRDVLVAKGYPVTYTEFHGGHDYLTWRNSLAEGLIALVTADGTPPE